MTTELHADAPFAQEKTLGIPAPRSTSLRSHAPQESGQLNVDLARSACKTDPPEAVPPIEIRERSDSHFALQKQIATLRARAALAGYELVHLADGTFIASRWGMFRSLDHIAAAEAFLAKVGAPA